MYKWQLLSTAPSVRLAASLLIVLFSFTIIGCSGHEYNPADDVYRGADAKKRITRGKLIPSSASNFYIFDGGNCTGTIEYWSFQCESLDDCWSAIHDLGGPDKAQFVAWSPSKFAVVMKGPAFYWPQLAAREWNVEGIHNGFSHEFSQSDRRLDFYAIDADRLIVYYHAESGGFPTDAYAPQSSGER
jgi:hypothetical protein